MAIKEGCNYYYEYSLECLDNSAIFMGSNEYLSFTYIVDTDDENVKFSVYLPSSKQEYSPKGMAPTVRRFQYNEATRRRKISNSCMGKLYDSLSDEDKKIFMDELASYEDDPYLSRLF